METTYDMRSGFVQVAPGLSLPRSFTGHDNDVNGYDVKIDFETAAQLEGMDAGRVSVKCISVTRADGGPEVTLAGIRGISLARLTREAIATVIARVETTETGGLGVEPIGPPDIGARDAGRTDDVLRSVAQLYRIELVVGGAPTKAISTAFGISQATAGRWVANARARGFLGPYEGKRTGS